MTALTRFFSAIIFCCLVLVAHAAFGDERVHPEDAKPGCCKNDSAEVQRLHKSADRLYIQFKPKEAAAELSKILQIDPDNFEAHIKLARTYIDIGDMVPDSSPDWQEKRLKEYRTAEEYARRAMKLNPSSTWGFFWTAVAMGDVAMLAPVSKQVELAGEIRNYIEKSISLDPQNGFAYHAYGVWQRKMAEIGKMSRVFASVLYGKAPPAGTLEKSVEYLKKAMNLNPTVIASRLELARSYAALENYQQARTLLASIRTLPVQFSDDPKNKQKAEQMLEEIGDR